MSQPALKRRRWRWLKRAAWALLVGAVLYETGPWYLPLPARFLDVSVPPEHVDYLLVLGGGATTRPFAAAAFVKAGFADKVLLPTGQGEASSLPEHEILRKALLTRGVPSEAIVVLPGPPVQSTADEAAALLVFLETHPDASLGIITNRPHTRRARWIFRRTLGEMAGRLRVFGAPCDQFDESNWWRSEAGFVFYTSEYLKLPFYLARY